MKKDKKNFYMHKALAQATVALKRNEVPVGVVIVNEQGDIIARAYNQIEKKQCHTAHAEVLAIQKACKIQNNWRLLGCTMYVTLEPCRMCLGLIQLSRLAKIVYGAPSTLFGTGLPEQQPTFAKQLTIEGGVLADKSIALLRLFFSDKRKKRKASSEIESRIHQKNKRPPHPTKK